MSVANINLFSYTSRGTSLLRESTKIVSATADQAPEQSGRKSRKESLCRHYVRFAFIFAQCCKEFYSCRICHDEHVQGDHADLAKHQVTQLKCCECDYIQPVSNRCANPQCLIKFGDRSCLECRLFDSTPGRESYHCDKCGICRLGQKGSNYHCERCDTCIKLSSKEQHVCVNSPLRDANCPICLSGMFSSMNHTVFLPCGHAMHANCFDEYAQTNYKCPICYRAMGDMRKYNAVIDEIVKADHACMSPRHTSREVEVYCQDCGNYSLTKYHYQFLKCNARERERGNSCGSYNTRDAGTRSDTTNGD